MSVTESDGEPIFLHTINRGGASSSFGIVVARMAGIPSEVVEKASVKLQNLESNSSLNQVTKTEIVKSEVVLDSLLAKELEKIDIAQMTPLEALNKLAQIKDKLKLLHSPDAYLEVN